MTNSEHAAVGRAGARLASLDIGNLGDGEAAALSAALEAAGIDTYEVVPGAGVLGGTLFSYPAAHVEDALGALAQARETVRIERLGADGRARELDAQISMKRDWGEFDEELTALEKERDSLSPTGNYGGVMDAFLEQGGFDGPWHRLSDPAKKADAEVEPRGKGLQMDEKKFDGVSVSVPKTVGKDKPSIRSFTYQDKETGAVCRMCEVTLPAHTKIGETDASFHHFVVKESQIKEFDNDPGYFHVVMPKANRDGEPWNVTLTRDFGGWEHPGAQGDERGKWVKDERTTNVEAAELDGAMREYREKRKEHAQRATKPEDDKSPAAAKDNARKAASSRTTDASAPSQAMAK